ncbi:MAG: ethanolamine utilization protein EutN [Proteobacteria bacterium]|nr:ethanolamine utilization protein EutN [Pseudomonadota bacterium]
MFLGTVIGKAVMTVKDPSLEGARFLVVQPQNADGQASQKPIVAIDVVSAGHGDRVYLVKGREACMPWSNPNCPVDACIVGIIDQMNVPVR